MPHMANLAWMPLFMLFNLSLLLVLCNLKLSSPSMSNEAASTNKLNKKWQW